MKGWSLEPDYSNCKNIKNRLSNIAIDKERKWLGDYIGTLSCGNIVHHVRNSWHKVTDWKQKQPKKKKKPIGSIDHRTCIVAIQFNSFHAEAAEHYKKVIIKIIIASQ